MRDRSAENSKPRGGPRPAQGLLVFFGLALMALALTAPAEALDWEAGARVGLSFGLFSPGKTFAEKWEDSDTRGKPALEAAMFGAVGLPWPWATDQTWYWPGWARAELWFTADRIDFFDGHDYLETVSYESLVIPLLLQWRVFDSHALLLGGYLSVPLGDARSRGRGEEAGGDYAFAAGVTGGAVLGVTLFRGAMELQTGPVRLCFGGVTFRALMDLADLSGEIDGETWRLSRRYKIALGVEFSAAGRRSRRHDAFGL